MAACRAESVTFPAVAAAAPEAARVAFWTASAMASSNAEGLIVGAASCLCRKAVSSSQESC